MRDFTKNETRTLRDALRLFSEYNNDRSMATVHLFSRLQRSLKSRGELAPRCPECRHIKKAWREREEEAEEAVIGRLHLYQDICDGYECGTIYLIKPSDGLYNTEVKDNDKDNDNDKAKDKLNQ